MILLVTNARDLTTDFVVLELRRRGLPWFRLNTERLPTSCVHLGWEADEDWSIAFEAAGVRGADVTAAYFRRPGAPEIDPAIADPAERTYCEAEWAAWLKSLYLRLEPLWLNSPNAIGLAEDKPRQLRAAQRLGFQIPDGLVTNDPKRLAAFVESGASIAKPLREALLDGAEEAVMFTSRLDRAEARDESSIRAAPVILQREIAKAADLRVTVVGDRVFAAAIDSQDQPEAIVDWRRGASRNLPHREISLPPDVVGKCTDLVAELGLTYGAIDLVEDRGGDYWFLECNPNGQWAWIETRTGLPIASAIVDHLASRVA